MNYKIFDNKKIKIIKSENFNHIFDKITGFAATWGATKEENPPWSPAGPLILDIEISTKCSGVKGIGVCKFCYKGNTPNGEHMTLDKFITVMTKLTESKTIGQCAIGLGDVSGPHANPDMWKMVDWCRENDIVPNATINGEGTTDEVADMIASKLGACAVSCYDKNKSYDTIKKLTDRGMTQCNIHYMLSEETYDGAMEIINDKLSDSRLDKLNAIVFLSLKPKGRASHGSFTSLSQEKFSTLVKYALDNKINIGMDSCSRKKFIDSVRDHKDIEHFKEISEGCEACRMSAYVSSEGKYFPCSFMDGEVVENGGDWTEGLDVIACNNFLDDIWEHKKTREFRKKCIEYDLGIGGCPHYKI